jgi:hypothetical protein
MLKPGTKRRRTKIQMEEARHEEECREDAMADKNKEIKSLTNELTAVID